MLHAAKAFLALFDKEVSPRPDLASLAKALDDLLIAYHNCDAASFDASDFPDPFRADYNQTRTLVGETFPEFGLYHSMLPTEADEAVEPEIGDAIDDLADIYGEISEIIWRWENTSRNDAIWHFRQTFEWHWGRHLIDLRSYIHHRMFGY